MRNLIDRQDVIRAVNVGAISAAALYGRTDSAMATFKEILRAVDDLPSAQSEQTEMIKEIRKWINSANRGNADYFIVDKIEEIINRYE